jgi:hypothetical protein
MSKDPAMGKEVIPGLSLAFAILVVLLYPGNRGTVATLLVFGGVLIFFLAFFSLLHRAMEKVYPGCRTWGPFPWLAAFGGGGILVTLLIPVLSGMAASSGTVSPAGSAGGLRMYENPALGFGISYPANWTPLIRKDPNSDFITNVAFIGVDGKTVATVQVIDLSGPGYLGVSLDTWTNHTLEVLRSNSVSSGFTLLRSEKTSFAGYPAEKLEYTAVLTSGDRIRTDEYLLEAGSRGYNIGFTSREDTFDDWSGIERQVFSSFRITG